MSTTSVAPLRRAISVTFLLISSSSRLRKFWMRCWSERCVLARKFCRSACRRWISSSIFWESASAFLRASSVSSVFFDCSVGLLVLLHELVAFLDHLLELRLGLLLGVPQLGVLLLGLEVVVVDLAHVDRDDLQRGRLSGEPERGCAKGDEGEGGLQRSIHG